MFSDSEEEEGSEGVASESEGEGSEGVASESEGEESVGVASDSEGEESVGVASEEDVDSEIEEEEEDSDFEPRMKLSACCKQKARKRPRESHSEKEVASSSEEEDDEMEEDKEYEDGDEEEGGDEDSDEEEGDDEQDSVSGASESSDVGASGFLDDEAMEVELSSEEEDEQDSVSGASESSDVGTSGFLDDEAMEVELSSEEEDEEEGSSGMSEEGEEEGESKSTSQDFIEVGTASRSGGGKGGGGQFHLNWKQDIAAKASQAYSHRSSSTTNLKRLIYNSKTSSRGGEGDKGSEGEEDGASKDIGGLFQLTKKKSLSVFHREDASSLLRVDRSASSRDWTAPATIAAAKDLFVTGNWGAEGAQALLDEDDALYGDFEDIENREDEKSADEAETAVKENKKEEAKAKKRLEKKKKMKAAFDAGYDEEEGEGEGGTYLEELKREVSEQERRNREEFEAVDERTRIQYEGVRPGYYVRLELKGEKVGTSRSLTFVVQR